MNANYRLGIHKAPPDVAQRSSIAGARADFAFHRSRSAFARSFLGYILYSMWEVLEHRRVDRQLDKAPTEVLKRYEKWKDIVRISGPQGLRMIRGFRDEALKGRWQDHRSSRLNQQYRVVYRVEREKILVEVVTVTPHEY